MSLPNHIIRNISVLLGLQTDYNKNILQVAGLHGIEIESKLIISLYNSIPNYLVENEYIMKCLSCIVGIIVHFHCVYHTPAFKPTYVYNNKDTVHSKYGVSVNQLVSISMMSQSFQCLFDIPAPLDMFLYDTINNNIYQPQSREYENNFMLEHNLLKRANHTLKLCCHIINRQKNLNTY